MGRKGISKQKPSKAKNMPVPKANGAPAYAEYKTGSLVPKMLNKGEAISISQGGKKGSSEGGKKKKKR